MTVPASIDRAGELADVLSRLIDVYRRVEESAGVQREAMRSADARALAQLSEARGAMAREIAALDRRRAELARAIAGEADAPIARLAERVPEPMRARLGSLAAGLRDVLARVHREHAALRLSSWRLANHVDGIVRHIARRLGDPGVYGPGGRVALGPPMRRTLDVTH